MFLFMKKNAAGFDARQQKCISHFDGPMLVLAGPGSGKTTVLTNRVRYLTKERGILPRNILVITFTNQAAEEMRRRYLALTGRNTTSVTFGTFHSVFLHFLLKNETYAPYRVAERNECIKVLHHVFYMKWNGKNLHDDMAEDVYDDFGRMKNGLSVEDDLSREMFPFYQEEMERRKLMDFDDMLVLCRNLLRKDPVLLSALRKRFRYLLIDEFQDINPVQYEIVRLLSEEHQNVFAVGDDDQSIYGFRGSDPSFMRRFEKDYKNTERVYLVNNYRSTGMIVKRSLELISHNRNRYRKKLVSQRDKGTEPVISGFPTVKEEAFYISEMVQLYEKAAEKSGYGEMKIALLARTHDALNAIASRLNPYLKKRISCMTFHSSKGLEFDVVFLGAAVEGITPEKNVTDPLELEEERRAFYVAMTRAKRYLHILYTESNYNKKTEISRFVKEIQ